jgi:hypothetical protein
MVSPVEGSLKLFKKRPFCALEGKRRAVYVIARHPNQQTT